MNQVQIVSLVRQVLLSLSVGFVTNGVMTDAQLQAIVSGLIGIGVVLWGLYARRSAGVVASAASLPEVSQIVTTPAIAAVTNDKVVAY